jgi:hypothetical protein
VIPLVRTGGDSEYVLHGESVWGPNGHVALVLLVRAALVNSGAFVMLGGLVKTVNLGARYDASPCECRCWCCHCGERVTKRPAVVVEVLSSRGGGGE